MLTRSLLAAAQGTIRTGMTAADIPLTHGQPEQGFEGNRFTGIPLYNALAEWDLTRGDRATPLRPGLALSWEVDAADKTRWVFPLRKGVKFQDGSAFNADAVVWNVRKVLDREAPHFDPRQVGVTATRMPTLRRAEKIDDFTVALFTSEPDSLLPINLTNLFMASPAHWQAKRNTAPNAEAAWLLSGQVDWIEAPAPDAVPQLRARIMRIESNAQPHVWPWQPCFVEG